MFSSFVESDVNPFIGRRSDCGTCMPGRSDGTAVVGPSDGRRLVAEVSATVRERTRAPSATIYGVSGYGGSEMLLSLWVCEAPRGMELL